MNTKPLKHIAVIMDGNGRWASRRKLPRTMGHRQGVEAAKRAVEAAGNLDIPYLTLFGFSSENWNRPEDEVNELMHLLRLYLRGETAELARNNVRLRVIGDRTPFADDIVELIENAESLTVGNTGLNLTIALNYGGRHDILQAAANWAKMCQEKGLAPDVHNAETYFPGFLMTHDLPDPDILIRTSGEERISNFLLWQCAYSELVFTPTLWPDFTASDLEAAIEIYKGRDRRFGGISEKKEDEFRS